MKFSKEKVSALSGETEVRYTQIVESNDKPFPPFQLVASKSGIRASGKLDTISSMEELEAFAKVVSDTWTSHILLKPKIEVTQAMPPS